MAGPEQMADLLLSGPRGRAVCLALSGVWPYNFRERSAATEQLTDTFVFVDDLPYDETAVEACAAAIAAVSVEDLVVDDASVTHAVEESVGSAMYWQEPDADDKLLSDRRVIEALRPIATALAYSPATPWWQAPLDPDDQYFVGWVFGRKETRADPPLLIGAAESRSRWRRQAEKEERRAAAERPADPSASYSGAWWSTPALSDLMSTTPRLADGTPAQLVFVEDPMGMNRARVARLQPTQDIRVFEINEPVDLVELVRRFPFSADAARRHDWYRATGCRGPWVIPDWSAIGEHFDAVHLSVLAYLSSAGRALAVDDHFTVLGGWDPSETWWLNDVLAQATEPVTWKLDDTRGWAPV